MSDATDNVIRWDVDDSGMLGAVIECRTCNSKGTVFDGPEPERDNSEIVTCPQCDGTKELHRPYFTADGSFIRPDGQPFTLDAEAERPAGVRSTPDVVDPTIELTSEPLTPGYGFTCTTCGTSTPVGEYADYGAAVRAVDQHRTEHGQTTYEQDKPVSQWTPPSDAWAAVDLDEYVRQLLSADPSAHFISYDQMTSEELKARVAEFNANGPA